MLEAPSSRGVSRDREVKSVVSECVIACPSSSLVRILWNNLLVRLANITYASWGREKRRRNEKETDRVRRKKCVRVRERKKERKRNRKNRIGWHCRFDNRIEEEDRLCVLPCQDVRSCFSTFVRVFSFAFKFSQVTENEIPSVFIDL